ncbi:MAG: hypothetical protein JWO80_6304 [Bryobacterales bacterium]|nr:hypothetical protein [Bryobacterales bacterium]
MLIAPSQFAVFHFDYRTGTWRTAEGNYSNSPEEETVLLFDNFAEAEAYCRDQVARVPSIFCRIYDRRGTAEGEVAEIYPPKIAAKVQGPKAARKKLTNGVLLLLASGLCVLVDWRLGGPVILGVVVGSKFLTSGIMRVVEGFSGLMEHRSK